MASLVLTASVGCGPASADVREGDDPVAQTSSAIIGGSDSPKSENAVVLIGLRDETGAIQPQCTGTLVAPTLVLTARHCVSELPGDGYLCGADGNAIEGNAQFGNPFSTGRLAVFLGQAKPDFASGNVTPSARVAELFLPKTNSACSYDIAFLRLDRRISVIPSAPIRMKGETMKGASIVAVGYGIVDTGSALDPRKRRQGIVITRVGPSEGGGATEPPMSPKEFEVGEAICQGDSGGPALDPSTGAVVGIVSRGGNEETAIPASCIGLRTRNVYIATADHSIFIQRVFDAAKEIITVEPQKDDEAPSSSCNVTRFDIARARKAAPLSYLAQTLAVTALALTARRRHNARLTRRANPTNAEKR